ncbi:MAG: DEAD/DEAH box helicase family protein [Endozoicomonadaceae bacterium]|nr:DEAD/DEAH box helicase family protein [Endozoicomonadaceae bacterium]
MEDNNSYQGTLLDNRKRKVGDYLKSKICDESILKIVSAYFTVYGFATLEKELNQAKQISFLYGDYNNIPAADSNNTQLKSFKITDENNLEIHKSLEQNSLAIRCKKWIEKDNVSIRSVKEGKFLHGKMYHINNKQQEDQFGVIGSSNFTRNGLGNSFNSNLELNLALENQKNCDDMEQWFDELWSDKKITEDVKDDVLNALERLGQEQSPEFIYYKTLYEIFKERLKERTDALNAINQVKLPDTRIYKELYEFQEDAVHEIIRKLNKYDGCILADSVGLGKTYTALAVMMYYQLNNKNTLVLCPNKLWNNWSMYRASMNNPSNNFLEDRLDYTVLSHTDLSRTDENDMPKGKREGVDLSNFHWGNYDLIVIDESHNFRNNNPSKSKLQNDPTTRKKNRYQRLLDDIIKSGKKTQVLMLSATPINNSMIDLRNQLYLITENKQDHFQDSLGLSDLSNIFKHAEEKFNSWSEEGNLDNKDKLYEDLGGDFLQLIDEITIARSRKQIKRHYKKMIKEIGDFPVRDAVDNKRLHTDLKKQISYEDISNTIDELALSIYTPTKYMRKNSAMYKKLESSVDNKFKQSDREQNLIGMMKVTFLKRLESSAHSFTITLDRTINKCENLSKKIDTYLNQTLTGSNQISGNDFLDEQDEDENDDFIVGNHLEPIHFDDINVKDWQEDVNRDMDTLGKLKNKISIIDPSRDAKLQFLRKAIIEKINNPTEDKDGKKCKKLLIFTVYSDTANYLYDNLQEVVTGLNANIAVVTGSQCHSSDGKSNIYQILDTFAPVGRMAKQIKDDESIDIVIATDCISEGQNLQDCDQVINYDVHWNPVRLIQRFGRVDRLGSRHKKIKMIIYWPTEDIEAYLNLERRVKARMAILDMSGTGEESPLEDLKEKANIIEEMRNKRMYDLLNNEFDFDAEDGPTLEDLTLETFMLQLKDYIDKNKERLEDAPNGLYAVTNHNPNKSQNEVPGIVFCLRDKNHITDKKMHGGSAKANQIYPYLMIYVTNKQEVHYKYTKVMANLKVLADLTLGKDKADYKLCDKFSKETNYGENMKKQIKLLDVALNSIDSDARIEEEKVLESGGGRDSVFTQELEAIPNLQESSKYELISWLIVN